MGAPDRGKPLFSRGKPFYQRAGIKPKLLKKLEISIFRAASILCTPDESSKSVQRLKSQAAGDRVELPNAAAWKLTSSGCFDLRSHRAAQRARRSHLFLMNSGS
jgi:hypothetical protein